SANVKIAASRLRQKRSCSARSSWRKSLIVSVSGQLEVDVFQRRPPDLEVAQLLAPRDRLGRQLVEAAGRLLGLLDDQLAVQPVADLRLRRLARQLGRCADAAHPP